MIRRPTGGVALLCGLLCMLLSPSPNADGVIAAASAQGKRKTKAVEAPNIDTVRFSYERWSRAGQQTYVLVPLPVGVSPGTLQDRVRDLFKAVVKDKPSTYGDARLAFQPDAAKTGVVYVYLDVKKAAYNPIAMAELVYTFTENGASKVIFPKVQEQGWTRDDVPFSAYVLAVPLYNALPPARMGGSLVKLPDGTLLGSEAAIDKIMKGDKALIDATWSYVAKGPPAAALAAVKAAPLLKLKDLDDRLIPVLKADDAALRSAALDGLEGQDNKTVNVALRAVMDADKDAALRDKAAGLLSASKDPAFSTAAQYHALRSQDPKIVAVAAKALGSSKQKEATEQLVSTLDNPDAGVRTAVIEALLERGDTNALIAALSNEKLNTDARIEAAKALASTKDKTAAHAGLLFLAVKAKGDVSAGAAAKLAEFDKQATYDALAQSVKHTEGDTRRAAASALSRLGTPKGLAPLAAADVNDVDSGDAMLVAIRTIYAQQPLDFVLKGTKDGDETLRRQAVATLGKMVTTQKGKAARKTIVKTLEPLSEAKDPSIRAAAARSYGTMGGDDVRPRILKLATDQAVEVQRAVAFALRAFPGQETFKLLLGFTTKTDAPLIANAVESLGVLKQEAALDRVVTHLQHKDVRVRRAATGALVDIGEELPDAKRKPMLNFFSQAVFDKDADVRLKAVKGLRLVKDPRTVTALAALLKDPVKPVRQATLNAMASTGSNSAVEAIATGLEDEDAEVRMTAIRALGNLKQKSASKMLLDYAKDEKDADLASEARKVAAALK